MIEADGESNWSFETFKCNLLRLVIGMIMVIYGTRDLRESRRRRASF